MTARKSVKSKGKAGTSKASAADKRAAFVEAFLSNNGNATQAAISAGFSQKTAGRAGGRLLKDVRISQVLDKRRQEITNKLGLSTNRLMKAIACIAFSDPRKIMHSDGRIKMPNELDDETAAAISSFEVSFDGSIKYKFWDKNSAHERSCKILGEFERDNQQKTDPLRDLLATLSGNVLGVAKSSCDD